MCQALRFTCLSLVTIAFVAVAPAEGRETENVILVTMDGLRWQELFAGADRSLINDKDGGARDPEQLLARFWRETPVERREALMPFFWSTIATQGQVFGDPEAGSKVTVTNGHYFSYPGYNEILTGYGDPRIDSNDKLPNPNVTVLEWLHQRPGFEGRVFAFASWDVFPFIINDRRSGIPVNAGWQPLTGLADKSEQQLLNRVADELPHYWTNVRYDTFTYRGAADCLANKRPRVLYVALGETDDWGHARRYDLYLAAAWQNDDFIRRLWETAQSMPAYRGKTSLVITTDHGRGSTGADWTSHGRDVPGSDHMWIGVLGPDTPPLGIRKGSPATQGQTAATVAALLGEDYHAAVPRSAAPLPGADDGDAPRTGDHSHASRSNETTIPSPPLDAHSRR